MALSGKIAPPNLPEGEGVKKAPSNSSGGENWKKAEDKK